MKLLKAVEKVKPDLEAIQPEKTLTGAALLPGTLAKQKKALQGNVKLLKAVEKVKPD